METVLLATDSDEIFAKIDATLANKNTQIFRVKTGKAVLQTVRELNPEVVILDLQIGNMGGVACSLELRQEEGSGRLPVRSISLLLDREADIFLANQAKADSWIIKPIQPTALRKMYKELSTGTKNV